MPDPTHLTIELERDVHSPGAARAALARIAPAIAPGRFEDARLLLSELVTNAVKYGGGGSVQVVVRSAGDSTHFEVIDEGRGFEARQAARARDPHDLDLEGGWGLPMVERLADEWGSFEGSTHVWFRLGPAAR